MVLYGQIAVGPPGSGKTTYCNGMQQYLRLLGRETFVVNLDPANECTNSLTTTATNNNNNNNTDESSSSSLPESHLPYETILDATEEIVNLSTVMSQLPLGPNGGLMYCMEYMEHHFDEWIPILQHRLQKDSKYKHCSYLLFDFPGQVELYTHSPTVRNLVKKLEKALDLRLCVVHFIDAVFCTDPHKFIAASLLSTTTMIRLELPTIHVLSKIDLLQDHFSLPFSLEYFTECQDLHRLLQYLQEGHESDSSATNRSHSITTTTAHTFDFLAEDVDYQQARLKTRHSPFFQKYQKLQQLLCEVVDDYHLLQYTTLNISDAESVGRLLSLIDRCNGYLFPTVPILLDTTTTSPSTSRTYQDMFQCALPMDPYHNSEYLVDLQEKYGMDTFREEIPELKKSKYEKKINE